MACDSHEVDNRESRENFSKISCPWNSVFSSSWCLVSGDLKLKETVRKAVFATMWYCALFLSRSVFCNTVHIIYCWGAELLQITCIIRKSCTLRFLFWNRFWSWLKVSVYSFWSIWVYVLIARKDMVLPKHHVVKMTKYTFHI